MTAFSPSIAAPHERPRAGRPTLRHAPVPALTQAAAKAEADAQAAKTAAANAQAEADTILAAYNKLFADVSAINAQLHINGQTGFPVTMTATAISASSSGSTGGTSGGSTGSGSTGTSGAAAAAAASNRTSTTGDTVTAATTTVSGTPPAELCYAINVTASTPIVTYRYTDGSTFVRTISGSPGSNGDGTYTFNYTDGGSDRLIYSGSGNSATGLISTGSTSNGAAFLVGTGVPGSGVAPFVEAQVNAPTTIWQGILSTGATGSKGSPVTTGPDAHGNYTVTFSDGSTFTHS